MLTPDMEWRLIVPLHDQTFCLSELGTVLLLLLRFYPLMVVILLSREWFILLDREYDIFDGILVFTVDRLILRWFGVFDRVTGSHFESNVYVLILFFINREALFLLFLSNVTKRLTNHLDRGGSRHRGANHGGDFQTTTPFSTPTFHCRVLLL